jgi:hypothetical protein
MENNKIQIAFAAINDYVESNIPSSAEVEVKGKDFIAWGDNNNYPDFLYNLYTECPTLQSIVNGITDFVCGNKIISTIGDIENDYAKCAVDYILYGSFALQIIENKAGQISKVKWLDMRKLRSNKDNTVYFYSEDWSKSFGRVQTITLPKFIRGISQATSVMVVKNPQSRTTYPVVSWGSAVRAALTEIEISKFHLNEICNNFSGSAIINFNNGVPSDEDKDQIEKSVSKKFTGAGNAGRFLLAFNDSAENAVTVTRLGTDDFDKRYEALQKKTRQELFTAFRANPNLFGIPTENLGFSQEEYDGAFKLFNRTVVKPIIRLICRAFNDIYNMENAVIVEPFSLGENKEETVS